MFTAELTRRERLLHLELRGELDLATLPILEGALPSPEPGDTLLLDLRELEFMDSSGLHVLMRLDVDARSEGWDFTIVRGGDEVQRILDLCHIGDRVRIVDRPDAYSR